MSIPQEQADFDVVKEQELELDFMSSEFFKKAILEIIRIQREMLSKM